MTDQAEADYEKTRKKKDPEFDRATYQPRLPDEILHDLVKIQLNSAACQNKGFILDGFPRSVEDSRAIFMNQIPLAKENEEEGAEEEQQFEEKLNEKIVPQYAIALEADDAALTQRAKDLPPEARDGTHLDDANMVRRLKEYRARNTEESCVKDFFTQTIGYQNVLAVDCTEPTEEQLGKMREIIEQKGKPCCINMITEEDNKFLNGLKKQAEKEARAKARAEAAQAAAEAEGSAQEEGSTQGAAIIAQESEEEIDELTLLIQKEDAEAAQRAKAEEAG